MSCFKIPKIKFSWRQLCCLLVGASTAISPVYSHAQSNNFDVNIAGSISIELNKLAALDNSCEFTFLVKNNMTGDVEKLALEFAFLDKNGQLSKLATLDFGTLITNRPKIAQFELPGSACENISQIFINSASECTGIVIEDCIGVVTKYNKTSVEF